MIPEDEADWFEARRIAEERFARYHRWNYGEFWEDQFWRSAIIKAEQGDNSELIHVFMVNKLTPWARNALAQLFRGYRLIKENKRPPRQLHEEFRMEYEQAADFVKLRRAKFKAAEQDALATGQRHEAGEHARRAEAALSEAARYAGVEEHKLENFINGKHGKKLPAWTYEAS